MPLGRRVETVREERLGLLLAGSAAVLYGAAYPATAVALRSFTPLGIAGFPWRRDRSSSDGSA